MGPEILYLRGEAVEEVRGGADLVSATILRILKEHFGADAVEEFYVDRIESQQGHLVSLGRALTGRYPAYSRRVSEALAKRCTEGIKFLFVDQSVYGLACADAKRAAPGIKCAVLFHNIERSFYLRRAIRAFKPHNVLLLPAITKAERVAVREADLLITLSDRDAKEMHAVYGRRPELVLPPGLEDKNVAQANPKPITLIGTRFKEDITMLFVGSAFPPNVQGIRWFARKVLPKIPGKLLVAGRGFEAYRTEFQNDRLTVLGSVADLGPLYAQADLVVSPIFWGSGIKMKTAEAFMYGMPFVGTTEALEGYDAEAAGALRADNAEGFIEGISILTNPAIRELRAGQSRSYYLRELSYSAAERQISDLLMGIMDT